MSSMLQPETIVRALPETEVVSCSLAGEAALLSLRHGTYYGLDAVGAHVWELIRPGRSVAEVQHALLQRFDVDAERCERDLRALFSQMAHAGLITMHPEPASETLAAAAGASPREPS